MREWLRLLAEKDIDPRQEAMRLRRSIPFAGLARRAFNSLNPANRDDFSHEVRAAMDTCLACKACAGQCPVKVSVPAFRSKFLELYYGRYLRPLKDPLVAAIETTLPLVRRIRPAYNMVVGTRAGRTMMRVAGLTSLPHLPRISLAREAARLGVPLATAQAIEALPPQERQRSVVFVADAFTAYFDPDVALGAIGLARKIGLTPFLAASHTNGKALHVHGYLGRFEAAAKRTARYLERLDETGVALVGLDPSMTLAFRSEYKGISKANVLLPQEWLTANLDRLTASPSAAEGKSFRLMAHCTERTNAPASVAQWQKVFESLGIDLQAAQTGCCGMAGTFGHEARNRPIAERLYALSWKPELDAAGDADILMATGYSCRSQVKEIDDRRIPHPLQVIARIVSEKAEIPHLHTTPPRS
jgi:Fe-S oxidoreductase